MSVDPATLRKTVSRDVMESLIRIGLVLLLVVACVRVVAPFANLLLWGVILAVALYPLFLRISGRFKGRRGLAATTLVLHATARGIRIESISTRMEGDLDLRGLLGLDDSVSPGYEQIRISFRLEGDDPEKLRGLVEQSRLRSAVYDVLTNGVPVSIEVTA